MERATLPSMPHTNTLSPALLERLQAEPWRYGFLALLRRIGADARIDAIGAARHPRAEPLRLGQQPSLAFAPREIADVKEVAGQLKVRLFGLGMLGPNGPLPIHVTEMAREREEGRHDTATVDFLDIFHHRYFMLLYRAWATAQATASLDRKQDEHFSFYVASLTGRDTDEIAQRALPAHACLAASAHLVRESRSPDGLCATLEWYFGVPVAIEENVFHWIEIDPADRGRIGRPSAGATMGEGAMLGNRIVDRQHRFRIVLGPLDLHAYQRFTPQGADLPQLVEWVREFIGYELDWELELRILPACAPPVTMGGAERLGWSGWLGCPDANKPVTGMCFEPGRQRRFRTEQIEKRQDPQ